MAPSAISITPEVSYALPSKFITEVVPHDVVTKLNYTKHPGPEGFKPFDDKSGIPESERRFQQREGVKEAREAIVHDIRGHEHEYKFHEHGFQIVNHHICGVTDWEDQNQINEIIFPAIDDIVKKVTGASKTILYLERFRNAGNKVGESMSTLKSPSNGVHTDVQMNSTKYLLGQVVKDPAERDRLLSKHFIVVNYWRPIKTIRRDPLGWVAWETTDQADIFPDRRETSEGIMELGVPIYNPNHRWEYLSGQKPDEPIIFKQLDSDPDKNITLLHSAFVDPKYANYPPRESFELKMFAFFDDE